MFKNKIHRKWLWLGMIVAGLSLPVFWHAAMATRPIFSLNQLLKNTDDELGAGKVCAIKDEEGNLVTMVSRRLRVGCEIITAGGKHYRVQTVRGNTATAGFLGMDKDILAYSELFSKMELPAVAPEQAAGPVAIYHTHTDESYLPSDGHVSIPFNGGILQVGDSYTSSLTHDGANVLHDKTPHDPHDNNAYYRSRRTAVQLLQKKPIAVFDVHRDGVDDPEFYRKVISNEEVAQIRLVVGRENPNMAANLDFAKRLMAYANQTHWPIVKEIFIGAGDYNQDLLPTAILLEAGTYTNQKEEAMRGIAQLADAVPAILGITGPSGRPEASEYEKPVTDPTARRPGVWSSLGWLLLTTLVGAVVFVIINEGSYRKARERMFHFLGWEMGDFNGFEVKKNGLAKWVGDTGRKAKERLLHFLGRKSFAVHGPQAKKIQSEGLDRDSNRYGKKP